MVDQKPAGPSVACACTTVTGVEDLSPSFRRIQLAGPELTKFSDRLIGTGGSTTCSDAYVKLLVPPEGRLARRPDFSSGYRAWFAQPQEERGFLRTYTVRCVRWIPWGQQVVPEITLDFVVHSPAHGPGSSWAVGARPGDQVFLVGPGTGDPAWCSWGPGNARRIIAVGDETAMPALLSIAEELAGGTVADRIDMIAELPTRDDFPTPMTHPVVKFHPLARSDSGAQVVGSVRELAHVLDLPPFCAADALAGRRSDSALHADRHTPERLWKVADPHIQRGTYVFLAGEAASVKSWRRLCINGAGIPKENVSFMGYWRRGHAES